MLVMLEEVCSLFRFSSSSTMWRSRDSFSTSKQRACTAHTTEEIIKLLYKNDNEQEGKERADVSLGAAAFVLTSSISLTRRSLREPMVVRSWTNWFIPSLLRVLAATKSNSSQLHLSTAAPLREEHNVPVTCELFRTLRDLYDPSSHLHRAYTLQRPQDCTSERKPVSFTASFFKCLCAFLSCPSQ